MSEQTKQRKQFPLGQVVLNGALILLVLLWTVPTVGLLLSSFRTRFDIQRSGWWSLFPHREWVMAEEKPPNVERESATAVE